MTARDTEPPRPAADAVEPVDAPGDFLRRWSRRKQAVARGETPPEPAPPVAPAAAVVPDEPPLPDPATLSLADDFSGFLRARVPEALKRQAMRQLFAQPHFNVVDGLDVYMEDFNALPDLPPAERALLKHAREVLDPTPQQALGREAALDETVPAVAPDTPEAMPDGVARVAVSPAEAPPRADAAAEDAPEAGAPDRS